MSASLPRLLAGMPPDGALSLSEHVALHGDLPLYDGPSRGYFVRPQRGESPGGRISRPRRSALIDEVERAGLRGRGGAEFPTAAKLRAVVASHSAPTGRRPVVVVNGAEGEPASAKDRTLLQGLPQLVLDGAVLAATAVGAHEILLGVCRPLPGRSATASRSVPTAFDAAARAIAERGSPAQGMPSIELRPVPGRYVAGHESALVNHLSGGPASPTFSPPRPFERGVRGRPTLVCNVETFAHLALIARHGAEWFRELGTPERPGSALVTLCGPVAQPGVYEIEHGSSLAALIDAADGLTAQPRAMLLGGYGGTWIDGSQLGGVAPAGGVPAADGVPAANGVALADADLTELGGRRASLGAGVVALLSRETCPVAELVRLTRWLASQSTRQCGPCVFGLDAIAAAFEQLMLGSAAGARSARGHDGPDAATRRLRALAGLVNGRGACSHPDGVARMVTSALDVFAEELLDHAHHGPCDACTRPSELPRPRAEATEARRTRSAGAPTPIIR